jgi:pyruvate,orthophosphate dikinase
LLILLSLSLLLSGFTMPTTLCQVYAKHGNLPSEIWDDVQANVQRIEKETGKVFGDKVNPLLFSVRSGAAISMPGMMDTVLNIGLNDETVVGLAEATNNPRFAWDAYRRLLNMFGDVVKGIPHEAFEERFDVIKGAACVEVRSNCTQCCVSCAY